MFLGRNKRFQARTTQHIQSLYMCVWLASDLQSMRHENKFLNNSAKIVKIEGFGVYFFNISSMNRFPVPLFGTKPNYLHHGDLDEILFSLE